MRVMRCEACRMHAPSDLKRKSDGETTRLEVRAGDRHSERERPLQSGHALLAFVHLLATLVEGLHRFAQLAVELHGLGVVARDAIGLEVGEGALHFLLEAKGPRHVAR